jgi:glycerophosphoryl diester phosphodiesterase
MRLPRTDSTMSRKEAMLGSTFNLQGHRGARGLQPENTLPSFEVALDVGVTSIETDLHRARDGEVVLYHDAVIGGSLVAQLTLQELRRFKVDRNPDPRRFPEQLPNLTPVASEFARVRGVEPFGVPTLAELFEFVQCYSQSDNKTAAQRTHATRLIFDLELKRAPGRPEHVGDHFDGTGVGAFEEHTVQCIRHHQLVDRCVIRSFDHRSVRAVKQLEPRFRTAILVAGTAPVAPEELARHAHADTYCPHVDFLDERQVRQLHAAGIAVLPWTVNEPNDWQRLLAWGVDGITTDFPDRLAQFLREHT